MFKKIFQILSLCLITQNAYSAVWDSENQWNTQYEENFGSWVKNSFNSDIFLKGAYRGLSTDCADAAYAARLIFSYENKLPFAIKDSTGGNILISNDMSRFDSIEDPNKRFIRFAYYIFAMTGTYSIPFDTYPIVINRKWLMPGTVNLHFYEPTPFDTNPTSSHTEIVKDILDTGIINFLSSTVPAKMRKLKLTSGFNFTPENKKSGLRNWKWPEQLTHPELEIEGYSLEQYNHPNETYVNAITNKLKYRVESTEEKRLRIARNYCEQITERIDVVKDSEEKRKYLDRKKARCFNAQELDDYSTPARDKRLKSTVEDLVRTEKLDGTIEKRDIINMSKYFDKCGSLKYIPGKVMSTTESALRAYFGMYSSDPNQFLAARWGDEKEQKVYCPEKE